MCLGIFRICQDSRFCYGKHTLEVTDINICLKNNVIVRGYRAVAVSKQFVGSGFIARPKQGCRIQGAGGVKLWIKLIRLLEPPYRALKISLPIFQNSQLKDNVLFTRGKVVSLLKFGER